MTKHQKTITQARAALEAAELFLIEYESKLPADLGDLWCGSFGTHFDIGLRHRTPDERNRALAHLGDTFGRGGWEAKLVSVYSFDGFDWSKTVDGVLVNIEGAQPMDQPKSFPVDPKQFPLQLEDGQ